MKCLSFRCRGHKVQEHMYNRAGHLIIKRSNSYPLIDKIIRNIVFVLFISTSVSNTRRKPLRIPEIKGLSTDKS